MTVSLACEGADWKTYLVHLLRESAQRSRVASTHFQICHELLELDSRAQPVPLSTRDHWRPERKSRLLWVPFLDRLLPAERGDELLRETDVIPE